MAKAIDNRTKFVVKRTNQGGKVKTSSMNKSMKNSFKAYRGQGR